MKQETYHSSTLGNIPLSFTGRRLLQNLREAFSNYTVKVIVATKRNQMEAPTSWQPVSVARGELAQYISGLERRVSALETLHKAWHDDDDNEPQNGAQEEPPLVFGALNEADLTTPLKLSYVYNLPAIPPGYSLTMINDRLIIAPFDYEGRE
jgi:hypothetical protein